MEPSEKRVPGLFTSTSLVCKAVTRQLLGPKFFLLSLIASRNALSDLTLETPTTETLLASFKAY